ncbi:SDR family oxidoreductase [Myxococcota bacterium]|nr:SDR family oxidoreductase [Myxococcota bacterium]
MKSEPNREPGATAGGGRVEGKVAIVTGGASGIGQATCTLLAREGARVLVADLQTARAQAVVAEIEATGGEAAACEVDVSDPAGVEAMVAGVENRWGRLDILFNNAALTSLDHITGDGSPAEVDLAAWDRTFEVDLRGAMLVCRAVIPRMIESGGGSIIQTSSNQALAGDMSQTAYAAAKAGVNQLSRSIATAYGRQGIRCNTVSPGMIRTPASEAACTPEMFEQIAASNLVARTGEPEDLAWAVLFLASDESSFITGQVLCVDGGQLAHLPHYADLVRGGTTTTR